MVSQQNSNNFMILNQMMDDLEVAPEVYRPSPFWRQLSAEHIYQLQQWGIANIKRTVNTKYFNWKILGILVHQFFPMVLYFLQHPNFSVFAAEFPDYNHPRGKGISTFGPISAWIYKTYVTLLENWTQQQDQRGLLKKIEEPNVGNPWQIRIQGRNISQDLCNSVYEFYATNPSASVAENPIHIAELGAGYGRLAYVFLSTLPNATYTIIDIPPALFVSQTYLGQVFPNEQIFTYRPFESYEEIKSDFEKARIRFLMAHQIALLPPKQFDTFITISSLHEMTQRQITLYLEQIDRLCCGYFYMKQWRRSRASALNQFTIRENEYPIPDHWQKVYHRRHPVQWMFFDALYKIY